MRVRLTTEWMTWPIGRVMDLNPYVAEQLIRRGAAVLVEEPVGVKAMEHAPRDKMKRSYKRREKPEEPEQQPAGEAAAEPGLERSG